MTNIWRQTPCISLQNISVSWTDSRKKLLGISENFSADKNCANIVAEVHYNLLHHLQILDEKFTSYSSEYGQGQDETKACKKLICNPFSLKPMTLPGDIEKKSHRTSEQ